ncbi:hypothetical protein ADUPG1_002934, partial [Aduncisulcus paluster]
KPVVNTVKSVDAVHSVKQNVSTVSSVNPKDSVSSVRPENSASGGSQSVREKESQKEEEEDDSDSTARIERLLRDWDLPDEDRIGYFFLGKEYEAGKERIDRERSEHVLKVVAQKEAKRRESEARLIPKKPREVSETVSAPDVKALVEEERTRAAFEVMGEDLTVKLDETLKGVEHVTDEDRERFGNSIAGVKETKCYFDVIISMLLVVGDLFSGLDEYPANVGKFRIELSDPDVVVSEPFR